MRVDIQGRPIKEFGGTTELTVTTHCPGKYILLDLETGQFWKGSNETKQWDAVHNTRLLKSYVRKALRIFSIQRR